jgi:hypothetical protein
VPASTGLVADGGDSGVADLDAFSLTKAFLDLHVRGDTDVDLAQVADAGDFVQVELP